MKYFLALSLWICILACKNGNKEANFTMVIYLQDESTIDTAKDIMYLQTIPHVDRVEFVSKEAAKKEYLKNDNDDWDKVLGQNPLPRSYNVTIINSKYTQKDMEELARDIRERMPYCSDVAWPRSLLVQE